MAEWFKCMSKGMKVATILYVLIVGLVLSSNIIEYHRAMDEARYALKEGDIAQAEEYLEYARGRVRSFFVTLCFSFILFLPIYQAAQRSKRTKGT
ncbi:hypothetical protein DRO48_02300 [Candidatus Bathyarchaeota archaeon]|nr:MAG: hypothetical protein DRO48_02300 [Candidatus Bathyarchaeota archaeon]